MGADDENICELAGEKRRYGYRRIHVLLRREGWSVNRKRTYRLYRAIGSRQHSEGGTSYALRDGRDGSPYRRAIMEGRRSVRVPINAREVHVLFDGPV
jgi:transposase InsO family protein